MKDDKKDGIFKKQTLDLSSEICVLRVPTRSYTSVLLFSSHSLSGMILFVTRVTICVTWSISCFG